MRADRAVFTDERMSRRVIRRHKEEHLQRSIANGFQLMWLARTDIHRLTRPKDLHLVANCEFAHAIEKDEDLHSVLMVVDFAVLSDLPGREIGADVVVPDGLMWLAIEIHDLHGQVPFPTAR